MLTIWESICITRFAIMEFDFGNFENVIIYGLLKVEDLENDNMDSWKIEIPKMKVRIFTNSNSETIGH